MRTCNFGCKSPGHSIRVFAADLHNNKHVHVGLECTNTKRWSCGLFLTIMGNCWPKETSFVNIVLMMQTQRRCWILLLGQAVSFPLDSIQFSV
jgi:hypothetical protein